MAEGNKHSFGKWHLASIIVLLYALVVLVALASNQSPETMKLLLKEGSGSVGTVVFLLLIFG